MEDVANFTQFLVANENEDEWGLHQKLDIKGMILFYPPDEESMNRMTRKDSLLYQKGFTKYKNSDDDPDFFDSYTPSKLVDEDDPPCLILQGTSDSLVQAKNVEAIKKAGEREDVDVIVVSSYFIGHTHDFTVFFTTMAIYYIERFMYLTKEE
ncbi:MAG: hypothetical protein ACTSPS_14855 [Promethearchaeota archaeon]